MLCSLSTRQHCKHFRLKVNPSPTQVGVEVSGKFSKETDVIILLQKCPVSIKCFSKKKKLKSVDLNSNF